MSHPNHQCPNYQLSLFCWALREFKGKTTVDGSGSLCALNNQTRTVGRTKDEIDSCRPYLTEEQFITVSQAERIFICIWPRRGEEEEEEEKDYDYCGMNRAVRLFFCVPLFSGRCVFSCCDLAWHYARQLLLGGLGSAARAFLARSLSFSHTAIINVITPARRAPTQYE